MSEKGIIFGAGYLGRRISGELGYDCFNRGGDKSLKL